MLNNRVEILNKIETICAMTRWSMNTSQEDHKVLYSMFHFFTDSPQELKNILYLYYGNISEFPLILSLCRYLYGFHMIRPQIVSNEQMKIMKIRQAERLCYDKICYDMTSKDATYCQMFGRLEEEIKLKNAKMTLSTK